MVNKNFVLMFVFTIFIFGIISAEVTQQSLGTFKKETTINLIQNCENSTYSNISRIVYPDSTFALNIQTAMTKINDDYSYSFNKTNQLGRYLVYGVCDINGDLTNWGYDLEITPSGFTDTLGFYIVLILILIAVIILGFSISEEWFVIIGGLGLIVLGIYSLNNGIAGFKDMFMTYAICLFEIGVGTILAIGSAVQKIDN